MKRIILSCTLCTLSSLAMAFGEIGQWSSGWGQGVSEYNVSDAQGNSLYIACSEDRSVSMILTLNGQEYGSYSEQGFDLLIDGQEIQTPYDTASRVGANNFLFAWEALRKAKTLLAITSDGARVELSTRGSAKVLPAWGTAEYVCHTDF